MKRYYLVVVTLLAANKLLRGMTRQPPKYSLAGAHDVGDEDIAVHVSALVDVADQPGRTTLALASS